MTPEFLYFDLGNVILFFCHQRAARQMAIVSGLPESRVYEVVFSEGLQQKYELGEIDDQEFHRQFCLTTGATIGINELMLAGSDIFWLNTSIVSVIGQLKAAGHRLGLLSNTCSAHWEFVVVRIPVLADIFSTRILSYQVQRAKPDKRIYDYAAEQIGLSPQQIFFVDDREDNVHGAIDAGFDAVMFTDAASLVVELRSRGIEFNY